MASSNDFDIKAYMRDFHERDAITPYKVKVWINGRVENIYFPTRQEALKSIIEYEKLGATRYIATKFGKDVEIIKYSFGYSDKSANYFY